VKYANVDKKKLHNGDYTHLLVKALVTTWHFCGSRSRMPLGDTRRHIDPTLSVGAAA